ncbi:MAG: class I SAM-dependent methyltransferase [Actinomycetota bacterium]
MGRLGARLYEPVLGRLLGGVRSSGLALCPPRPGMLVLDVGCGTGAFLASYAAAGCRVAGVEASAEMLGEARRHLGPGALLVQGDAASLPFSAGAAGVVAAMMLFHSLSAEEGRLALMEMARVAGESGRVLVADHRPGRAVGLMPRAVRSVARAIEGAAGHGDGVRSLLAAGGMAALAAGAGLEVEARLAAAGGSLEVLRLGRAGAVA